MNKYLQLHDYYDNKESHIYIYNLCGKYYRLWKKLEWVEKLDENKISWRRFQRYFKWEYLSQQYYDKNILEFFELWLGNMAMEEYGKIFLELLSYVDFVWEEKFKTQHFLNGL